MHDKNGKPIKKGDKVLIEAEIAETYARGEFLQYSANNRRRQTARR